MRQKQIGHALARSFKLDVYGAKLEWERNLEAARLLGVEIEKAVEEARGKAGTERLDRWRIGARADCSVGLTAI